MSSDSTPATTTTSDERLFAGIAHLLGLVVALIVWALQKDKSRFVRFQALQAVAFDLLVLIVMFTLMFCTFGTMFAGTLYIVAMESGQSASSDGALPVLIGSMTPFLMFACLMPIGLVLVLTRFAAAISVFSGRNFRYPILASRVEAFLARN